jgi:type VI secretion system protein ImpL
MAAVARGLMATGPFRWIGGAVAGAGVLALLWVLIQSFVVALVIVLILALLVVIFLLIRQNQEIKASKEIEQTITRQADIDIQRSSPGKLDEMRGLKEGLLSAIASLKSGKAAGRGGKGALSLLPWYMLIGPPDSGKGTLVRRSGLHFPLVDADRHPRAVRGVGGTRSFEWWLSQEAVLLDMRGRTLGTVGLEDADDWHAFLQVLRKQRKAKPLNGLIVTVPLEQVADQNDTQVTALARNSRERLQELIHHLQTVFPVYVIFTKCDRVAGFSEFFASLDTAEQNQPWGATLSVERSRSDSAERLFDEEFAILLSALSDRRMALFSSVPDPGQRSRVFTFPLQMESVRANARRFLRVLFEAMPGEENPIFRGFYFTSAVQEGVPIDRVLDPVLQTMGPAAPIQPRRGDENGSFFIHDLLRRVIFPDASLAVPSTRAEAARRRAQWVGIGVLGVLAVFALIASFVTSSWSRAPIRRTREAAANLVAAQKQGLLLDNLEALERLRASVADVDSFSRKRPAGLIYYSGGVLVDPATQFYATHAVSSALRPAAQTMSSKLTQWNVTGSGSFLDYYNLFAAWRLLANPGKIQPEDAPLLSREVDKALQGSIGPASSEDQRHFRRLIWNQLRFLSARSNRIEGQSITPENHALVADGVERIVRTWDSNQFFDEMIRIAGASAPDKTLEALIGKQEMLSASRPVDGPFTEEGYETQVAPLIQGYGRRVERDAVVTEAFQSHNPPNLAQNLKARYAAAYSAQWAGFLNEIDVTRPKTLQSSEQLLRRAASEKSPILQLLREVERETSLEGAADPDLGTVKRDFRLATGLFHTKRDEGSGLNLKSLMDKLPSIGKSDLVPKGSDAERYVSALESAADQVLKANQPDASVTEMTKLAAYGDEASNPIRGLRKLIRDLQAEYGDGAGSTSLARVLELPLYAAVGSACDAVKQSVADRWTQDVVEPFRKTLEGRYPLSASGPEASLPDFTEFFRPGGTFWSFYQSHLQKYLSETGEPKGEEGTNCFSPEFVACLRQAYEIREAFFMGGTQEPSLRFQIKAYQPLQSGSVLIYGTSFDLGGVPKEYKMGVQRFEEVRWPGPQPDQGAWVRVLTGSGAAQAQAIGGNGAFGLFRLLDQGTPSGDEFRWISAVGGANVTIIYQIQPGSARHPFVRGFLRFSLPQSP